MAPVLIFGAGGGVGLCLAQLLRRGGVSVAAMLRSPAAEGGLSALGAHGGNPDRPLCLAPFVTIVLYGAGIAMAWRYRDILGHPFGSSFATLLTPEIILV